MPIDQYGIWRRNITWFRNGVGRTDIQRNTLHSHKLRFAVYTIPDGRTITVKAEELRDALKAAPTRQNGMTVGPYNVDILKGTILDHPVNLTVTEQESQETKEEKKFREIESDLRDEGQFDPTSIEDARDIQFRAIVQRSGQSAFRNKLLKAYQGKCAISGTECTQTLEAAHIVPYLGDETNHIQNGVLLRSDLHTLFDLDLLKITEDMKVRIDLSVKSALYRQHDGAGIFLPIDESDRPSPEAIRKRNNPNK